MNVLSSYKGIIDSTLREGQQFRFANFSLLQQKRIVRFLSAINVDFIEVGNPIANETKKIIIELTKITTRSKMLAHVRNKLSDIQAAVESGVEGVNILCSIEENRLAAMHTTFEEYLHELQKVILFAKSSHLEVRVSVEHFFRSKNAQAIRVYKLSESFGVHRIGVADTTGMAMNWEVEKAIKELRNMFSTDIEVHFHNDLGLANSNLVSAVKRGANWVDTTLLGIGERNGIPALSSFLVALYRLNPLMSKRYNLQKLTQAENAVANMIGHAVPFNLLTNKENGFSHKAGIHLHSLINLGPQSYEVFSPRVIGNTRKLIHGTPISGKTTEIEVNNFYKKFGRT